MVTTPNYDLDIDTTLGGDNASDYVVPSQKAIKAYVDNSTGGNVMWGNITGTLSNQTDLQNALDDKYDASNPNGYTSNVGTVTSVNNVSPVNGNVTLSIPDTSNLANKDLSNLSSTGNAKFQAPLLSGTNIKTINGNSILGSGNLTLDGFPSQTGQSGKFLTTDGTDASWADTTKVIIRDWSVL